jgi:hypothetical protein
MFRLEFNHIYLRHSHIPVVPHDAADDDTKLCIKQCVFAANRAMYVSTAETELVVATRRLMQAEENTAQAGARVLQQWNDVKAILGNPPKVRYDWELENAKEALDFAKEAHNDAKESRTKAELDKAHAAARLDAAASVSASGVASAASSRSPPSESSSAVFDSRRPFSATSEQRHAVAGAADSFSSSSNEAIVARNAVSNARPVPDAKSKVCFADSLHPASCLPLRISILMSLSLFLFLFLSFCLLLCLCLFTNSLVSLLACTDHCRLSEIGRAWKQGTHDSFRVAVQCLQTYSVSRKASITSIFIIVFVYFFSRMSDNVNRHRRVLFALMWTSPAAGSCRAWSCE